MNNLAVIETEGISDLFVVPPSVGKLGELIDKYDAEKRLVMQIAETIKLAGAAIEHFTRSTGCHRLNSLEKALASLNSSYWRDAMALTDVMQYMPEKRRQEWYQQIESDTTPEFSRESATSTIMGLLNSRPQFLAEKVDGIFRALSGKHVTNEPQGFGKRMIIAGAYDRFKSPNHAKYGYVDDLRYVVAQLMGRDSPAYHASYKALVFAGENAGEWIDVDGGALRIKGHPGAGSLHIEIHPDMAWRLNKILACLYPMAIPAKFRTREKAAPKAFFTERSLLSFGVIGELIEAKKGLDYSKGSHGRYPYIHNSCRLPGRAKSVEEAGKVLEYIGGVKKENNLYLFDYDPWPVIERIVVEGYIPEQKSHQYYPTPGELSDVAIRLAEVDSKPGMKWGEFSAGQGAIAEKMPKEDTLCVELSSVHCAVLESKGLKTVCADFLAWAPTCAEKFDRVVINPPYSEKRWKLHTEAAAKLITDGGRLVAILPTNAKDNIDLPSGFECFWSMPYEKMFADTGISVVIMCAVKKS